MDYEAIADDDDACADSFLFFRSDCFILDTLEHIFDLLLGQVDMELDFLSVKAALTFHQLLGALS